MAKPATSTALDVAALRSTVSFMDELSQSAFSEIAAIARLALNSMEAPRRNEEDIARALDNIAWRAENTADDINRAAGEVECAYTDEAALRRVRVRVATSEQEGTSNG